MSTIIIGKNPAAASGEQLAIPSSEWFDVWTFACECAPDIVHSGKMRACLLQDGGGLGQVDCLALAERLDTPDVLAKAQGRVAPRYLATFIAFLRVCGGFQLD